MYCKIYKFITFCLHSFIKICWISPLQSIDNIFIKSIRYSWCENKSQIDSTIHAKMHCKLYKFLTIRLNSSVDICWISPLLRINNIYIKNIKYLWCKNKIQIESNFFPEISLTERIDMQFFNIIEIQFFQQEHNKQ